MLTLVAAQEAIRLSHNELAAFQHARGDPQGAFKSHVRSRDYCSTPQHTVQMCLALIAVAFELPSFASQVANYVQKAEQALEATGVLMPALGAPGSAQASAALAATAAGGSPAEVAALKASAKLKAASALSLLDQKKYKHAARRFTEIPPDLEFSDVLSGADVATYGALTALASFDRAELRQHVVDNVPFRTYLELLPELRDLVADFYASRYSACLSQLQKLRQGPLIVDIHLRSHTAELCDAVRRRAVCAYVAPFSRVRLADMAAALNSSGDSLEAELTALILDGHVSARIDRGAGVLVSRTADARLLTFERTLAAAGAYLRDTRALLVRASLAQNDVVQKGGKRAEAGFGAVAHGRERAMRGGGWERGERGMDREREHHGHHHSQQWR